MVAAEEAASPLVRYAGSRALLICRVMPAEAVLRLWLPMLPLAKAHHGAATQILDFCRQVLQHDSLPLDLVRQVAMAELLNWTVCAVSSCGSVTYPRLCALVRLLVDVWKLDGHDALKPLWLALPAFVPSLVRLLDEPFVPLQKKVLRLLTAILHEPVVGPEHAWLDRLAKALPVAVALAHVPWARLQRHVQHSEPPAHQQRPLTQATAAEAAVLARKATLYALQLLRSALVVSTGSDIANRAAMVNVTQLLKAMEPFVSAEAAMDAVFCAFLEQDNELVLALRVGLDCWGLLQPDPEQAGWARLAAPDSLFARLARAVDHDSTFFLDLITGSETEFLGYLVAYLKWARASALTPSPPVHRMLLDLRSTIERLHAQGLFPFTPTALLRLLPSGVLEEPN